MRRLDGLADVDLDFQRYDFRPDVAAGRLDLLESVIGGESGHHGVMGGNEDPEGFPGTSDRVSMRAMVFIRVAVLPTRPGAP